MLASAPPLASLFTAVNDSVRSAAKCGHLFWSLQLEKASCAAWRFQVYWWPSSKITCTPFKVVKLLLGCSPFYRIRYWPCTAEKYIRFTISSWQISQHNDTTQQSAVQRKSHSQRDFQRGFFKWLIRSTWLHVIEHYEEEKEEEEALEEEEEEEEAEEKGRRRRRNRRRNGRRRRTGRRRGRRSDRRRRRRLFV